VGKSSIEGRGAFTSRSIRKGEAIDIGISYFMFVPFVTEFGSWINHAQDPNSFLLFDENDDVYYVRAKYNLPANTEITIDYKKTPSFIEGPMDWYV
jgi:hypothetical protein